MGHLFRMLNLARVLRRYGCQSKFFLNDHQPSADILGNAGFAFSTVDLDAVEIWAPATIAQLGLRVWINDRLDTSGVQARAVVDQGIPLVTFDDRGSGAELSDLHIAALAFDSDECLHGKRVLRGLEYLVLNPEIVSRRRLRTRLDRIIVTLGGADTYGVTAKVMALLKMQGLTATIVTGPAFEASSAFDRTVPDGFTLKSRVPSLIDEMWAHDLAITGGGVTAFEAAASGLPVIMVANEWFEVPVARHLDTLGAGRFAGHHSQLRETAFRMPEDITGMSRSGLSRVPLAGANAVCRSLLNLR